MNAADSIIALGVQLSAEKNAAHDLWTWLPSYKVAQLNHRDYASEFCPSVKDVLTEAAMFVSCLQAAPGKDYTLEEKEWFARCPCGEDHVGE
jgi:hypothetical protein